jgi:hypothetical protein
MSATCPACGVQFRPQRSTARFCSPRCRKATQRARDRGMPINVAATQRRKAPKLDPRVVPHEHWPGMFRIRRPDGSLSDMVNLTRVRDALCSIRDVVS